MRKLYLQNFKGVQGVKIIDFEKDIVFLTGPNGYGKTTVFDAIEICLTGGLYRIDKLKVQDERKNIEKAYYHNDIKNKVVLKLFFELEKGVEKMIIAYDAGSRNSSKPRELHFDFYVCDYNDDIFFDDFPNNFPKGYNLGDVLDKEGLLGEINKILEIQQGNFEDIYKIFHYLQQEETTYFLKKSEHERKNSLNFLFGTEKEAESHKKIMDFYRKNAEWIKELESTINQLKEKIGNKNDEHVKKIEYNQIFSENDIIKTEQFSFDNEKLFDISKNSDENLQLKKNYLDNFFNIKTFLGNFSSEEYEKYIKKEKIIKISQDIELQKYILLYELLPKIPELKPYNDCYGALQIENIFEIIKNYAILSDNKIKKEFNFYNNVANSEDKYIFSYFVLKNIIEDKNIIETQKFKNELSSISEAEIENFIISPDLKNEIGEKKEIFGKISNEKGIASVLFQNFFEVEKYEKLKKSFDENKILSEFINKNFDEKYKDIEKVVKILGKNDNFLDNFLNNLKRKDDLVKDIGENDKIISSLNALREELFSRYKIQFLGKNNFDNACFFCGATEINNQKIQDINHFRKFFDEKTGKISSISQGKTVEIEKINKALQNFINSIEGEIQNYLQDKEIQHNKNIFEKISQYITKEEFYEYRTVIKDFSEYALEEIPEDIDEKIINVSIILQKEKEKYDFLYNKTLQSDIRHYDVIEKFIQQQKIDVFSDIEDISIEKFDKKKEEILAKIKNETLGFDKNLFKILLENLNDYNEKKHGIRFIEEILGENYQNFILNINDYNLPSFIEKINSLKEEILKKLQKSYDSFKKVQYLEKNFSQHEQLIGNLREIIKNINGTEDEIKSIITNRKRLYNELSSLSYKNISDEIKNLLGGFVGKYMIKNFDDFMYFDEKMQGFQQEINDNIGNINIDEKNIGGENFSFVKIIFNENIDLIKKYQNEMNLFDEKQKYIEYKFFEYNNEDKQIQQRKLEKYQERMNILQKVQNKKLVELYNAEIKEYKENIVKNIQIPFFLYSARILQNFGQGFGIFISINTKSKDGIDLVNESVTFSVGGEGVDVMHQLSSGQLAVVSIAFLLAVNKVYNQFKYGKFILIDDPIQEMDVLNIHSFVELIKYNFLGEFFMIMSTHNDDNALFMKYKIEQIAENQVGMINIQRKFYNESI